EADIGMVAKALAPEDVREVDLDDRQIGSEKGVEHRDRSVGKRARVEDDSLGCFTSLLDPIDQLTFVIGLAEVDLEVECCGAGRAALLDVAERVMAIDRRVANPEQVEVGAVQNEDGRQAEPPLAIARL